MDIDDDLGVVDSTSGSEESDTTDNVLPGISNLSICEEDKSNHLVMSTNETVSYLSLISLVEQLLRLSRLLCWFLHLMC
jgi:hypothetical protein